MKGIALISIILAASNSFISCSNTTLNCNYVNNQYSDPFSTYGCFIESLTFSKTDKVVDVTGSHLADKSNTDVTGFVAGGKGIEAIPYNLHKFFQNLEYLVLQGTSISSISQDDLKVFPNLRAVEIFESQIEVIPGDLFNGNKKLEWIDLHSNKLRSIDAAAFQGLENLKSLFLDRNTCIDEFAPKNRERVLELIESVKVKC